MFYFTDKDCNKNRKKHRMDQAFVPVFMRVIKEKQTNKTQENLTPSHYIVISNLWGSSG